MKPSVRVMVPQTRAEEIALLSRRIEESGLSVEKFSRFCLYAGSRSVFRWLSGDGAIPERVLAVLIDPRPPPWPPGDPVGELRERMQETGV